MDPSRGRDCSHNAALIRPAVGGSSSHKNKEKQAPKKEKHPAANLHRLNLNSLKQQPDRSRLCVFCACVWIGPKRTMISGPFFHRKRKVGQAETEEQPKGTWKIRENKAKRLHP